MLEYIRNHRSFLCWMYIGIKRVTLMLCTINFNFKLISSFMMKYETRFIFSSKLDTLLYAVLSKCFIRKHNFHYINHELSLVDNESKAKLFNVTLIWNFIDMRKVRLVLWTISLCFIFHPFVFILKLDYNASYIFYLNYDSLKNTKKIIVPAINFYYYNPWVLTFSWKKLNFHVRVVYMLQWQKRPW